MKRRTGRKLSLNRETIEKVGGGFAHRTTHRCHETYGATDCTGCTYCNTAEAGCGTYIPCASIEDTVCLTCEGYGC